MAQTNEGETNITAGKDVLPNRQIKDSVFSDLFGDKKYLLELYHTLHPEDTSATQEDLSNVTIKNVLMNNFYNDLGFTVCDTLLILTEAQATWNANIAYRLLIYLSETWSNYVKETGQDPYGATPLELPEPEFYVVYTGKHKNRPSEISLSHELLHNKKNVNLIVKFIYFDEGDVPGSILNQYIMFSKEVDRQFKENGRNACAVKEAIRVCKEKDVLKEYLTQKEKEIIGIMETLLNQEYMTAIALERSEKRGRFETLYELVKDSLLSLANAAKKAGQSEEEFAAGMESYFLSIGTAK